MEYFGENCKTTPPSMFFPVFTRFIKAYKVRQQAAVPGEQFQIQTSNRFCPTASGDGEPAEEAAEGPEPPGSNKSNQRRRQWEQGERQI